MQRFTITGRMKKFCWVYSKSNRLYKTEYQYLKLKINDVSWKDFCEKVIFDDKVCELVGKAFMTVGWLVAADANDYFNFRCWLPNKDLKDEIEMGTR
jgi:hypothetical protein